MRRHRESSLRATLLLGTLLCAAASALANPSQVPVQRPAEATGTIVVPDRYLRRWDPVTVFFAEPVGPAKPGPEDRPERFVRTEPAHPGVYRWVDARTLQFQPADPWPPLGRVTFAAAETSVTLTTLLEPPVSTIPGAGETALQPVEAITLRFSEPLQAEVLQRMASIELQPLPGISGEALRLLTAADFTVKVIERTSRSMPAAYVLALRHPIPLGMRATLRLRLALEEAPSVSSSEISFSTAEPFRVAAVGCLSSRLPVAPEGTRYGREQALDCGSESRSVAVELTGRPGPIGPVEGRNLVRVTPAVDALDFSVRDRLLVVTGDFAWETEYKLSIADAPVVDEHGRLLEMGGPSEVHVYFPRKPSFLRWAASQGMVERFGPQRVPIEGRGDEQVDLRIYPIEPLERSFWPFDTVVRLDEARRPPSPGEEPAPHKLAESTHGGILAQQIRALTLVSPAVSEIVRLPLRKDGSAAAFGLDLAPFLRRVGGAGQPGTYLVGMRRLDGSTERHWMRLQVTDLSLSTVEEPAAVVFAVTSIATGLPVPGARVRLETLRGNWQAREWATLAEGRTDERGLWRWAAPGRPDRPVSMQRFVVEHGGDTLVLDPQRSPDAYADNQWFRNYSTWLQWTLQSLTGRGPSAQDLGHIFTERPVYRPEEVVHVKGYLRRREAGRLQPLSTQGFVIVEGPGELAWRFPVTLTEEGSFHHAFTDENLPTGVYRARFEDRQSRTYGGVSWRMEAYRIPQFEVQLHAPDWVPLDREMKVSMTATYYAGGRVAEQPVRWRVTQFPHTWSPPGAAGFLYSSDARFSQSERFESTPSLVKEALTDAEGLATLELNPTIEPTAQPRSYVVEATVTGADGQTVTTTRRILALPPFALGIKAPRYLEAAEAIRPEILVVDPDGKPLAGREVTVRLLHRQWHSHLRASDFSDGVARYVTDVVDEKVFESKVQSTAGPLQLELPIREAGVYVIELEAHDRLSRAQTVSVDLYAGGTGSVTWAKPASGVFSAAADQAAYDPGQTAALVLRSPFQSGRALAIVEAPEGNRYEWLPVEGGRATFHLAVLDTFVPRVPVHFVLMRGRVPGVEPLPGSSTDLGKPATLAATEWVKVNPVENRVEVQLRAPARARPGETIEVEVELRDPRGAPLAGEVTLWLVDAAVLALGKEQRLDPLPDFITEVRSFLRVLDTRGLPFGFLPFAEAPGGDEGDEGGLLDHATVRKNFQPVPFYDPAIRVGADGKARVRIELPDDVTVFKLRAKAISGPGRFGFSTGQIAVRLPLVVQPALPRFVRPGDSFTAMAIGRIVEGDGGPGSAEIRVGGVTLLGSPRRELTWATGRAERIELQVEVPSPPLDASGELAYSEAVFTVGVERAADGARDAFEVRLPVRGDRDRVTARQIVELAPGRPFQWPAVPEAAREGSVRRAALVTDQPAVLRLAAGLDFLMEYPYGCTEQRLSRARAALALGRFRELLHLQGQDAKLDRAVRETLEWVPLVVDEAGLCAYWPGSRGYVSLTAWVVQFLVEARSGGHAVDDALLARLTRSLQQALRSDYNRFLDGEAYAERTFALTALADAGRFDAAYAAELGRKAQFLELEDVAAVALSFARSGQSGSAAVAPLMQALRRGVVTRLHGGREVYGGLQEPRAGRHGLILPSETRTLAQIARAAFRLEPEDPRNELLRDALVTLGRGDGWGTTNANAAALLALAELIQPAAGGGAERAVAVRLEDVVQTLSLGAAAPVVRLVSKSAGAGEIVLLPTSAEGAVVARLETSYVPAAPGSEVVAAARGFVVARALLVQRPEGAPPERFALEQPGLVRLQVGDVVEEHVQVVNPEDRHAVAIVVPLAAGMEPLNPALATAPPEARPSGRLTLEPSYVAYLDDSAAFYYDTLPKGTYDFYFRTRATVPGSFVQPGARAEMMYDASVTGRSAGARVEVARSGQ
jgi:alpha-2-macroglobulin